MNEMNLGSAHDQVVGDVMRAQDAIALGLRQAAGDVGVVQADIIVEERDDKGVPVFTLALPRTSLADGLNWLDGSKQPKAQTFEGILAEATEIAARIYECMRPHLTTGEVWVTARARKNNDMPRDFVAHAYIEYDDNNKETLVIETKEEPYRGSVQN